MMVKWRNTLLRPTGYRLSATRRESKNPRGGGRRAQQCESHFAN